MCPGIHPTHTCLTWGCLYRLLECSSFARPVQEVQDRLAAIQELRKSKGKGIGRTVKKDDAPQAGLLQEAAVP